MKFFFAIGFILLAPSASTAQDVELPQGLGDLFSTESSMEEGAEGLPFDFSGSADVRFGSRLQNDPLQKTMSIAEARLQLSVEKEFEALIFTLVSDFVLDPVVDHYSIDLEKGRGVVDLREANVSFSPLDFIDMKIGRQVLTWGTGDLVFINDLFAKDWNSFFIGRDDEYLKAPSDALKASFFFDSISLDLVYVPRFDADRFIDGRRISFFDPLSGSMRGRQHPLRTNTPDRWFHNDEIAARVYGQIGTFETALYYYNGFWKSPLGFNPLTGSATHPSLSVYGASLRGPVVKGILWLEAGFYKSASGAALNPLLPNNEIRFLMGYEEEIGQELTGSVQYYLEQKQNYDAYLASLPTGAKADDKARHRITVRLTKMLMQQNLRLSLFNVYSPSDQDGSLRFNASYKINDSLRLEGGGNIFYGPQQDSFFGQFKDASTLYTGLNYAF